MNKSSRPPEHPGGIIGWLQRQEGPDGINSNIGSTVQHNVGACFFCCTVHLLVTTTKLRSDAFVQAAGDFDGNLCISLCYFGVEVLVMVRAGVIKIDIFST